MTQEKSARSTQRQKDPSWLMRVFSFSFFCFCCFCCMPSFLLNCFNRLHVKMYASLFDISIRTHPLQWKVREEVHRHSILIVYIRYRYVNIKIQINHRSNNCLTLSIHCLSSPQWLIVVCLTLSSIWKQRLKQKQNYFARAWRSLKVDCCVSLLLEDQGPNAEPLV